jgi:hypothetical protein
MIGEQAGGFEPAWRQIRDYYLPQLRILTDTRSILCVRYLLHVSYFFYHYHRNVPRRGFQLADRENALFVKEFGRLSQQYPFFNFDRHVHMEAFYYAHGLRICPQVVRDYVRSRDIIDCGAAIGDSLAALDAYTDRRVISYEIIANTAQQARESASHFSPLKHLVLLKGLGRENSTIYLTTSGSGANGLWNSNGSTLTALQKGI